MWKQDSNINPLLLEEETINTSKYHAKYLEILSIIKLRLKHQEMNFDILLKDKWLWYNGKMTKTEIDKRGWDYDPLSGLKLLKGDMDKFYDSDPHIQEAQAKIYVTKVMISTVEEIINTLRWRHNAIKNIIEFNKFTAGM